VLINLGGNAIKFSAQGEVVVSLAVVQRGAEAVTLEIAVRDSGIGIAPENQKHIFSGFSQAEASTTRRFGGTGLGLAICKRLVGLMGSELRLDSEIGRGSRFHFRIDLTVGNDAVGAELAPPRLRRPVALRVLVVDDNPSARILMGRMAQSMGWQVTLAEGGAAALACLQREGAAFDAIFIDWQMPGLDGWDTCAQIHQGLQPGARPLIIMVTAHGREMLSHRSAEEQARVNGFLVKPVTASMLYDAVVDARADPHAPAVLRTGSSACTHRLAGLRLLVVEDNANNQQVARELLEDEGAEVQIADNGLLGVEAVAAADPPFDVVLMDLQMPVMDGYTATTRIREDLQQLTLPIVAMTANAMTSDREACLAAGMNEHVGKPFDLEHLVTVLRRLAGRSASAAGGQLSNATSTALSPRILAAAADAGVDIERALDRLGGKIKAYGRTLQTFTADLRGLPLQLDKQLRSGERDAVRRELHTLKGVAATVGVTELSKLAGEAEELLAGLSAASEEAGCVARVGAAIELAAASLDALCTALGEGRPAAAGLDGPAALALTASDSALLADLLRSLQGLLQASDLDAGAALQALRTRIPAVAGPRLEALETAVESLEFESALSHCGQWLEECET
jgi:CheY-like chemotaxis protein/HPt (histidine-containing phosphotransfer) domain-containing protein